jgi:hypothetical protein
LRSNFPDLTDSSDSRFRPYVAFYEDFPPTNFLLMYLMLISSGSRSRFEKLTIESHRDRN